MTTESRGVRWFAALRLKDVPLVGGKNASLGELYAELGQAGVRVPNGFALTADAYRDALTTADAWPRLHALLDGIDVTDVALLEQRAQQARQIVYDATGTDALHAAQSRMPTARSRRSMATRSPSRCAVRRRPRTFRPPASPASTRAI